MRDLMRASGFDAPGCNVMYLELRIRRSERLSMPGSWRHTYGYLRKADLDPGDISSRTHAPAFVSVCLMPNPCLAPCRTLRKEKATTKIKIDQGDRDGCRKDKVKWCK